MTIPRTLLLAAALFPAAALAQSPKVALVELFTSEGCSSCPPADALLRKLAGSTLPPGTLVVALSEHVTYWNSLGWADPFSQTLFTDRQSAYGDRFQLGSVYTPQIVVNGARQVLGSDESAVTQAVIATASPAATLKILAAVPQGHSLHLTYTLQGELPNTDLYAVLAEDMATSSVLRGENSGRRLTHVAIARTLLNLGPGQPGTHDLVLPLPKLPTTPTHVVLFLQTRGFGPILGVDSRKV